MSELVHYNAMRQALIKAHSIDEVKDLRDRAESLRAYAKQAGESLENQNLMAEIKLRAERRAGEILAELPRDQGTRTDLTSVQPGPKLESYKATIKDAGIAITTAKRWQTIAKIPEQVFEAHVAETKAEKEELTSYSVHKLSSNIRRAEKVEKILEKNQPLEDSFGPFNVIYADPPWQYEHSETDSRKIENQYPTMTLDEICALPIPDIASEDAVLFLWATSPKLAEAMRVVESWGFTYRTSFVWVKDKFGMGYYCRGQHEILLVAAKGSLPVPREEDRVSSVISSPRREHSAKPHELYSIIERMYPEYARVELFARNKRTGWQSWGNQS